MAEFAAAAWPAVAPPNPPYKDRVGALGATEVVVVGDAAFVVIVFPNKVDGAEVDGVTITVGITAGCDDVVG